MKKNLTNIIAFNLIMLTVCSCSDPVRSDSKATLKEKDSTVTKAVREQKDYSETGFELMKNESIGEINLDMDAKRIIELLGKPDKKTKAELWGADGAYHQQWKYLKRGIELDLTGEPQTNLIVNMITISAPCELKTKRNIGIGSSYEDVQTAYKPEIDPADTNQETIVAGSVYGGMIFTFTDKKLKSIFIGAGAE